MNILIADDHALHRELMRAKLESVYPNARIIEAENGVQVRIHCDESHPELLILDVYMPGMNGMAGVHEIVQMFPETKVLICSAVDNPVMVRTMLAFGIKGYVTKSMSTERLLKAIDTILAGGTFIPKSLQTEDIHLTQRQTEILGMICSGLTNKEIADRLNLSLSTVKFHVSLILDVLGAQNRQQVISRCSPG